MSSGDNDLIDHVLSAPGDERENMQHLMATTHEIAFQNNCQINCLSEMPPQEHTAPMAFSGHRRIKSEDIQDSDSFP